jgi:site-specific recombinase XerC
LREILVFADDSGEEYPYIEEFCQTLAIDDLALTTIRAYRSDIPAFFHWFAPHRIESLTSADLIDFRQYLSKGRCLTPDFLALTSIVAGVTFVRYCRSRINCSKRSSIFSPSRGVFGGNSRKLLSL